MGLLALIGILLWTLFRDPDPAGDVLFEPETGKLGYRAVNDFEIESITYRLDDCSVVFQRPRTVRLDSLPVTYDSVDEHKWKIRTAWLISRGDLRGHEPLRVPQEVRVTVRGIRPGDGDTLHVFTDEDYAIPLQPAWGADTATLDLVVGARGFAGFLDLSDPKRPRLPADPLANMVGRGRGPVAVLVVSATNHEARSYRRSHPVILLRSGARSPGDVWTTGGSPNLAYVSDTLPPLVVFQSANTCSRPQRNGVYASTLDGGEVFPLSPPGPFQSTLARVEPGPPARIYYRSNFPIGGDRVCYEVVERHGHPRRTQRVDEAKCRDAP